MDVLASYMQWYTENSNAFPNRYNLKNDEEKLSMIMNKDGAVAKDLDAIKNAYNYPDICHFVKYDDMVTNPEQEFKKIYKFLNEPYFNHRFNNLKVYNPYIEKIPQRIREKYEHIRF
jgi:hypothetical protein